jgi:hypothetical protein
MEGWGYLVRGSRSNLLRSDRKSAGAVNDDRDSRNIPGGNLRLSVVGIFCIVEQVGNYSEQDTAKSLTEPRLTSIMEGEIIGLFLPRPIKVYIFPAHGNLFLLSWGQFFTPDRGRLGGAQGLAGDQRGWSNEAKGG